MSKSESIRQMLRSNPNMGANDCINALRKQGVVITSGLFYNAKASMQTCKTCNMNPCACVRVLSTLETIKFVKELAKEVGGFKELSQLVEAMS